MSRDDAVTINSFIVCNAPIHSSATAGQSLNRPSNTDQAYSSPVGVLEELTSPQPPPPTTSLMLCILYISLPVAAMLRLFRADFLRFFRKLLLRIQVWRDNPPMYRECITPLTPYGTVHCYRNNGRNQVVFPVEKTAKNPPGEAKAIAIDMAQLNLPWETA